MEEILGIFPKKSLLLVEKLLELPLPSKQKLLSDMKSYNAEIDKVAATKPGLDVNLADCLFRACTTLIEEVWDDATDQQRKLIQIACEYFIIKDEEEGDLNSVFGFDDDACVFNAVTEYLDREDLLIQV